MQPKNQLIRVMSCQDSVSQCIYIPSYSTYKHDHHGHQLTAHKIIRLLFTHTWAQLPLHLYTHSKHTHTTKYSFSSVTHLTSQVFDSYLWFWFWYTFFSHFLSLSSVSDHLFAQRLTSGLILDSDLCVTIWICLKTNSHVNFCVCLIIGICTCFWVTMHFLLDKITIRKFKWGKRIVTRKAAW